jgi:CheY-like chemotaxis protein
VVDSQPLREPVYVDGDMWAKIVLNLLSNAFKFTLEGRITVRLWADGSTAVLEVSDTGTGIPADDLPHLFERFYRMGRAGQNAGGHRHRPALVAELAKLHGGDVGARSAIGHGSTFTVRIPFGSPAREPDAGARSGPSVSTSVQGLAYVEEALRWIPDDVVDDAGVGRPVGVPGQPARILLADDNADMREYLSRLLRRFWHVEPVADGQAALAAVRADPPDLVITDVMMPRLDGFGLMRALRENPATRTIRSAVSEA